MLAEWEPLRGWLKWQRRSAELHLDLMALAFDLDGALAAGQHELAWRTRDGILVTGVELRLRELGQAIDDPGDHVARTCELLTALGRLDPARGDRAWELVRRDAPVAEAALHADIDRAIAFVRDDLGVAAAGSREVATRAWADTVRLLREIGQGVGIPQSDDWYLHEHAAPTGDLDWYDAVLDAVSREAHSPAQH